MNTSPGCEPVLGSCAPVAVAVEPVEPEVPDEPGDDNTGEHDQGSPASPDDHQIFPSIPALRLSIRPQRVKLPNAPEALAEGRHSRDAESA